MLLKFISCKMSFWFVCTESAEEMIKVKHRDTGMVIAPGDDNDSEEDIEVEEGMRVIVNYISLCVTNISLDKSMRYTSMVHIIHLWYTLYIYGTHYTSMVHIIHLWYTLYIYSTRYTSMVHVLHL